MSARRPKAVSVWEIDAPNGLVRVNIAPLTPTMIVLQQETRIISLDAQAWRALCDLRNIIKPARIRRDPH